MTLMFADSLSRLNLRQADWTKTPATMDISLIMYQGPIIPTPRKAMQRRYIGLALFALCILHNLLSVCLLCRSSLTYGSRTMHRLRHDNSTLSTRSCRTMMTPRLPDAGHYKFQHM